MSTNLQFLNKYTARGVQALVVTDCFTDAYDFYQVHIKVDGRTVQTYDWFRFVDTSGNVISDSEYAYAQQDMSANSTSFSYAKSNSATNIGNIGISGTALEKGSRIIINVFEPYDSNACSMIEGQSVGWTGNGYGTKFCGVHKVTERTPGFQLISGSGTYNNIQAKVFGVK